MPIHHPVSGIRETAVADTERECPLPVGRRIETVPPTSSFELLDFIARLAPLAPKAGEPDTIHRVFAPNSQYRILEFDIEDYAANRESRQALRAGGAENHNDVRLKQTPMGYLMEELAMELGLTPEVFHYHIMPFEMIRIKLGMK